MLVFSKIQNLGLLLAKNQIDFDQPSRKLHNQTDATQLKSHSRHIHSKKPILAWCGSTQNKFKFLRWPKLCTLETSMPAAITYSLLLHTEKRVMISKQFQFQFWIPMYQKIWGPGNLQTFTKRWKDGKFNVRTFWETQQNLKKSSSWFWQISWF